MRWWDYLFAGLLVILFVIWCFRSMQKGYDQDEDEERIKTQSRLELEIPLCEEVWPIH